MIFDQRHSVENIFDELVSEMVKGNTLLCEYQNLKQTSKKLTRLSAFAFFSIVVRMKNSQLLFLMVNYFLLNQRNNRGCSRKFWPRWTEMLS